MNELMSFEGKQVTIIHDSEQPLFLLKDICEVLELGQVAGVKRRLGKDVISNHPLQTAGGRQNAVFIDEDGLYDVVLESRKPEAKRFRKWVTKEVLPTIRKHGAYMTSETIERALSDPDTLIKLATNLKEERTQRLIAEQRVNELQPKADYYDSILKNKSLMTISIIAKNYGMSATKMNELLHDLGVQYKQSKTWLLYGKHQEKGYTHTEMIGVQGSDNLKPSTKWTQKGHIFIYELLKKNDILPLIERK